MRGIVVFLLFISYSLAQFPPNAFYHSHEAAGKWMVDRGRGGVANAILRDTLQENGWFTLDLTSDGVSDDKIQAYGAGFLEGAITQLQIWQAYTVFNQTLSLTTTLSSLQNWVAEQDNFVRTMVANNVNDPYWRQVGLSVAQWDGLYDGYQNYAPLGQKVSKADMTIYMMSDEIGDIMAFLNPNGFKQRPFESHCSVLVRVSSDKKSLFASHDTWSTYTSMLRIFKFYNLQFNEPSNKASRVTFSSYPAVTMSSDDYYFTNQNLVIMETTNEILNQSLYNDYISTKTVPFWIRITVANRMATGGNEWSTTFARYNSGTYNNQYQIVDYKLFAPSQSIKPNTLWIAEQIPGFVVSADVSDFLVNQGFWPSYNIPYFPFIYNISGYPQYYEQYGNMYSYGECARAQIFRRDAKNVQTMDDMKKIMRYNEYQSDPLSLKDACKGISARCDLNTPWTPNPMNDLSPFGGIDSKITDNTMVPEFRTHAVNGPTWDSQPPFAWTNQWASFPSLGIPQVMDFDFYLMEPINK